MKINQNLICLKIDDNYEYEDEEIFNKCRRKFKEKKYVDDFENEIEKNYKEIIKIQNNKI